MDEKSSAKIPCHLAIIMDGNDRWAEERGLPPLEGYRAGAQNISPVIEACIRHGIKILTLHAPEGWGPDQMDILWQTIGREMSKWHQKGVGLRWIGRLEDLPEARRRQVSQAIELTKGNDGLILGLALNYRGRAEIVDAVRRIVEEGIEPERLDEALFDQYLYTAGLPDPDLIVRTGGELRLFDFFVWQGAYAEYYATPTCWPDFDEKELQKALREYSRRKRKFGLLPSN